MTDRGWVKAGELHEGSKVLNSRKKYYVVESIEYKGYNGINVYNLIVENYHTFFITESGLMVHNIDCKNATLWQIFKQVGDNISDTKIKGDFEEVIKKLDDIASTKNIEEYIKKFDSRFRGLDPNNLDEIKKIISDTSKDINNHSSTLFKGTEGAADPITKSEYSSLRKKTPNNDIRKMVNPEGIKIDPVYGYVTDVLEADHIVPMKEIVDMPGFSQLSREQQIEVLNLKDNFIGLGKPTNASKGAKNWSDWQGHSKLGEIPSDVRSRMLELDATAREALMKAIEERLKKW